MPRTPSFIAPPTARSNNRVNTSSQPQVSNKGQSSQRYVNIIAPGGTIQIPAAGTQFYFRTATTELQVRPSGGNFSAYQQGEGLNVARENAFTFLDIRNESAGTCIYELFIGFDGFIDNKLILSLTLNFNVLFPTYTTPNSAAVVTITDRAGTLITDINGKQWYAIQRIAILVFNPDTGVTLLVQQLGSVVANGPAVGVVYPQTTLRLDCVGSYTLHLGGANINAVVSEIYNCIPK